MDELLDRIVLVYYTMGDEWVPVESWDTEDLVELEIFVNSELQRRGEENDELRYSSNGLG